MKKMVSTRQSSSIGANNGGGSVNDIREVSPSRKHQASSSAGSSSTSSSVSPPSMCNLSLFDLPVEIIEKIFSYLNYNTVAHLRPVSHQMDRVCGNILNSAFQKLQAQMLSRFQAIKSQMPRRESARRNHPLACESDIIETLHMRLTLLQMCFGKHIERKHCCFFPGEILDEVFRILHYIKVTPKLARPYKVTDELFDLSTMAMEYFKERIEPMLPEIPYFGADFLDLAGTFPSASNVSKPFMCLDSAPLSVGSSKAGSGSGEEGSPPHSSEDPALLETNVSPPQSNMVLRKRIRKIKQGMKRYNSQLTLMRRDLRSCKAKIAEQQKQIVEYATRLDDNDKKNEETSRKFSTLLQELNKCKTELQYWRSKSPAIPVCVGCGQSMPVPTEDLQALVNQGVMPEVFGEGLDFIPIADAHSPTEVVQQATVTQSPSPGAPSEPAEMAPPKAPIPTDSLKRKSSVDETPSDSTKKPRRTAKSRQAKRSKL
ncbi:F-box only protein 28-like isoform X1 [Vespa mandarinia]|uniref:F-box only protein 28-like isoform X1 n=1 Tax=Vespa mandarinia TaxID=7446 RepID=UPI00160C4D6A|nr:F-box only protein 28-like isoform X1 [Vespa mandarinia]XP_046820423.1 F-box only protein 28 isoform X1 [Vespa crabro]XP_046820432.1 F-box only protein 28 isoform X1 [Vespa crabro]XP_046820440.1 F-box only protein 28 isoform X1 [Vespa crabro]XP_046820450.1 F-box only protein 28 isoform X1 [Vespa crabro]XP_046820459.1 F-box only protein 28 isoform X1 [Vespa crabro]XP_047371114.1 F-box only protein 28 isoform X1 [Vespa velutina]XP_047371115.1 F-box only protein 28 isoform X1 [Vespa velutina